MIILSDAWYSARLKIQTSEFGYDNSPAYFNFGEYGLSDVIFFLKEFGKDIQRHVLHVLRQRGFPCHRVLKIWRIRHSNVTNVGENYKIDMTEIISRLYGQQNGRHVPGKLSAELGLRC